MSATTSTPALVIENESVTEFGRRILAFIAIVIIVVGQLMLYAFPSEPTVAIPRGLWITIGGVVLFLASRLYRSSAIETPLLLRLSQFPKGTAWICAAVTLSVLTTLGMVWCSQAARTNYMPVLFLWFGTAACYLAAFLPREWLRFDVRAWVQANRQELLLIGLVTLVGIGLRFYQLGSLPRVVDGDEGLVANTALSTGTDPLANPFSLWENFGGLYLQAMNLTMTMFGQTPFALRLLPAIGGSLAVLALYLLTRQIAGSRVALLTAAMLAVSHAHIHFSRTVAVAYIQGTWLAPLELYLLLSGLQRRSSWRAALGGIILGVHFSVYLTAQVITGLVIVYLLIGAMILRSWFNRTRIRQVVAFWGGLVVMLLPEGMYAWQKPEEFFNRLSSQGTFQSGWLGQQMAETGRSAVDILSERVLHAFLSLFYYPAIDFYGSSFPLMSLLMAGFMMLGIGLALVRFRDPGYLLLNGYFWGGIFSVGLFATPPSADTYRVLIAIPAAFALAGIALDAMLNSFGLGWDRRRVAYTSITGAVLTSLLIFNVWIYFGDFLGHCRFGGDRQTRFSSYLGSYLGTLSRDTDVYLLSDDVFFYGSHPSVDFLSRKRTVKNLRDPVNTFTPISGDMLIASPQRLDELEQWAHAHPGGTMTTEYDCRVLILRSYQIK